MRSRTDRLTSGGPIRLLVVTFVAASLLLAGCGVPISPEAITATAVARQDAGTQVAAFGGSTSDDAALSLRSASVGLAGSQVQPAGPIATLASPDDKPAPDATPGLGDAGLPDADTTETTTPEYGATTADDAGDEPTAQATTESTPEVTAEASASATETPSPTNTPEPTATPRPAIQNVNQGFAQEFLTLLNAQRTGRGLGALSMNGILTTGATQYAGYMGTAGFFGHDAPDGSTPASRAGATGYPGSWNGEALSAGQPTPQMALNALLASPPHAAILLDPASQEVGVGYAFVQGSQYIHYWVVVTGIP